MMCKAVLVDDEIDSLYGMEHAIKLIGGIEILAKESVPEKAVDSIIKLKPDLLFLDVEMPRLSGFDVLEQVNKSKVFPNVIFVTGYNQYAIKAIKKQALDYLLKPVDLDELKGAIDRFVMVKGLNGSTVKNNTEIYLKDLTGRERDVLHLVLQGKSSKDIATVLFVSKSTVDSHRKNILEKTGMKTIRELVAFITGNLV
jgi:DNA-binding NarL/FixJ family response regulator